MPDARALEIHLRRGLDNIGTSVPDGAVAMLVGFVDLVLRWNRIHNLTAVRDAAAIIDRHVLDSLRLLPIIRQALDASSDDATGDVDVLDVGSGAGLPSIPLAVCEPDWRICSIEANGKKARFQRQVKIALELASLDIRQQRIESLALTTRVLLARAFAPPARILDIGDRHVITGGHAILMPGRDGRIPAPLPVGWQIHTATTGDATGGRIVACRRVATRDVPVMDYTRPP